MDDPHVSPRQPPEILIRPGLLPFGIWLREVVEYRDLFYLLTWKHLAVRYKQTALGVIWVVAQPLVASGVFAVFLGGFAGIPSEREPYYLMAAAGMVLWTFFQSALSRATESLVASGPLVTKVYLPRIVIPAAVVAASLVDLVLSILALMLLVAASGRFPTVTGLAAALAAALGAAALATGVGAGLGVLNARLRDVRYMLPFVLQVWFFATPVVYPAEVVPEQWRFLVGLNPMFRLVEAFRAGILGRESSIEALGGGLLTALAALAVGLFVFRRYERRLADVL